MAKDLKIRGEDQGSWIKDWRSRIEDEGSMVAYRGLRIVDLRFWVFWIKDRFSRIEHRGLKTQDRGLRTKDCRRLMIVDQGPRVQDRWSSTVDRGKWFSIENRRWWILAGRSRISDGGSFIGLRRSRIDAR